jgi:hypothetical protein
MIRIRAIWNNKVIVKERILKPIIIVKERIFKPVIIVKERIVCKGISPWTTPTKKEILGYFFTININSKTLLLFWSIKIGSP